MRFALTVLCTNIITFFFFSVKGQRPYLIFTLKFLIGTLRWNWIEIIMYTLRSLSIFFSIFSITSLYRQIWPNRIHKFWVKSIEPIRVLLKNLMALYNYEHKNVLFQLFTMYCKAIALHIVAQLQSSSFYFHFLQYNTANI